MFMLNVECVCASVSFAVPYHNATGCKSELGNCRQYIAVNE